MNTSLWIHPGNKWSDQLSYIIGGISSSSLGIDRVNIETKSSSFLIHELNFHTYGIDGIHYYKDNYLYVVENELLSQVSRFSLNEDATHLISCEFLEKNTPDLRMPSTEVSVDDYFYFIA